MKRVDILYGGELYSVGGRSYDDLRAEIEDGVRAGFAWLRVNHGEGMLTRADLLITPGVDIALVAASEDLPEKPLEEPSP